MTIEKNLEEIRRDLARGEPVVYFSPSLLFSSLQPIYDIIVDLMCTGESLSTSQAKEIARLMPQCAASVRHIGFGG
jgi:hypothetical protein